jgi:hypothetical protein
MKRALLISIHLILWSMILYSQRSSPENHRKDSLSFHGAIALSRIGAAPVPVPPIYHPCLSAGISVTYGRISYEPVINCQQNGRPWIIDNWLHYRLYGNKKWRLVTGINPFLYFPGNPGGKPPVHGNLNLSAALSATCRFSGRWSMSLDYRYDWGFDGIVLTGHFICTSLSMLQDLPARLYLRWNLHAVCFDYPGQFHGLFGSTDIYLGSKKWKGSVFFQALQPLACREGPVPFIWNAGVAYTW